MYIVYLSTIVYLSKWLCTENIDPSFCSLYVWHMLKNTLEIILINENQAAVERLIEHNVPSVHLMHVCLCRKWTSAVSTTPTPK